MLANSNELMVMLTEQACQFIQNKLRKGLPGYLTYHSIEHMIDVCDSTENIGKLEGSTPYEMELLLTASWYHDAGYLKGAKGHEEESCRIAKEALPRYNYTHEDIGRVCGLIMATRIPQSPQNHLQQIMADADLDYLGRDDYFTTAEKFFQELKATGAIETEEQWLQLQVSFLEQHHYFTQTAISLRQKKKEEHLAVIRSQIKA